MKVSERALNACQTRDKSKLVTSQKKTQLVPKFNVEPQYKTYIEDTRVGVA